MPTSTRDYTDSEAESDSGARAPPKFRAEAGSREGSPTSIPPQSSPTRPGPSTETHHPIRITLRPNLSHLVHDPPPSHPTSSDRSSLSPPPPITLRLNRQSIAEKATYSSSEEESSRPKKKSKVSAKSPKSRSKNRSNPTSSSSQGTAAMPAQHRKAYDWLAPSSASASHHGPPERAKNGSLINNGAGGTSAGHPAEPVGSGSNASDGVDEGEEVKKGRTHKKRSADAPAGPGKAWRRGLKKGMAIPWREGMTFSGEPGGPAIVMNTPPTRDHSPESSSPEPLGEPRDSRSEANIAEIEPPMDEAEKAAVAAPRSNRDLSPAFVVADPEKLGIPIFKKPIVAPKITLSTFPKVTQFFAPINGGDPVFPRKEPVRRWKHSEKAIVGVGGGSLRVKTWHKGPPSELARLIQIDREERDAQRAAKKAQAASALEKAETSSTGGWEARPPLVSAMSFDSTGQAAAMGEGRGEVEALPEMAGSEIGDGEESIAGAVEHSSPVASSSAPKSKKSKSKAKPRKSKLAQEIVPLSAGLEDE